MESMDITPSKKLNKPTIRRGLMVFCILAMSGLLINFLWWKGTGVSDVLKMVQWKYLGLMPVLVVLDWVISAYRLYIFGKAVAPQTTLLDYVRADLANTFMGGVTPSQTGGGPAQIYILQRAGVPVSASLALGIINLLSTFSLFFVATFLMLALSPNLYPPRLKPLVEYGFWTFGMSAIVFGMLILKPEWCLRMLWHLPKGANRISQKLSNRLIKGLTRLDTMVHEYKAHLLYFIVKRPWIAVRSLLVTAALYFNKLMIAYFVVQMLGVWPPFWHTVGVMTFLFFIIYFAPTPGAGGIAEVCASLLMSSLLPEQEIPYFALLWRLFSLYLPMMVGWGVIMRQLSRDLKPKRAST
ncbi:flippase-like domain-containing protein [Candidatus Poribacteria bacterium]|nr:flippase-like domain-containing protein [Candidatus Poribacteria bacterium]